MYCKRIFRRLRPRRELSARSQPTDVVLFKPLPPTLVQQIATPITDMADVERLLAHLHCAKVRGYF